MIALFISLTHISFGLVFGVDLSTRWYLDLSSKLFSLTILLSMLRRGTVFTVLVVLLLLFKVTFDFKTTLFTTNCCCLFTFSFFGSKKLASFRLFPTTQLSGFLTIRGRCTLCTFITLFSMFPLLS